MLGTPDEQLGVTIADRIEPQQRPYLVRTLFICEGSLYPRTWGSYNLAAVLDLCVPGGTYRAMLTDT